MRDYKTMISLILKTAIKHKGIKAVVMNGSRTNPNAPKDCFQDYDIVYVVDDIKNFTKDHKWVDVFGERIIMQMPEDMEFPKPCSNGTFTYLMLFTDGNRIDLTLIPKDNMDNFIGKDSLSVLLLDKEGIIEPFHDASDRGYFVEKPSEKVFLDCCNEFWWVINNVAKGVWRDELPYAMEALQDARNMLNVLISWFIGVNYDFNINVGKSGKYFKKYLDNKYWEMYSETYCHLNNEELWQGIENSCNLFRELSKEVANKLKFNYLDDDANNVTIHLNHIKTLDKNIKDIY